MLIKIECFQGDYGVYEGKDIERVEGRAEDDRESKGEKMNILNLRDLRGKDVSFVNGEKLD